MTTTTTHDATRQGLCGCAMCDRQRTASLAASRAAVAVQKAAWHPRSRKLAAAATQAIEERDRAIRAATYTYTWRTDAAHGEVEAGTIGAVLTRLISEGEWAEIDSDREARDLANGAWLLVRSEDTAEEVRRGTVP